MYTPSFRHTEMTVPQQFSILLMQALQLLLTSTIVSPPGLRVSISVPVTGFRDWWVRRKRICQILVVPIYLTDLSNAGGMVSG